MASDWESQFKYKFEPLRQKHKMPRGAVGISLKFRVPGGFYRWHSKDVFDEFDDAINEEPFKSCGAIVVEHETGPEILCWGVSVAKAALCVGLAALAVNTTNMIVNIRRMQKAEGPIEVIIRGGADSNYREESLIQTDSTLKVKQIEFERKINKLMDEWVEEDRAKTPSKKPANRNSDPSAVRKKDVEQKTKKQRKR